MFVNSPIYASLPAADLERAKRFYAEKLGLTPESELPGGLLYCCGGDSRFSVFTSRGEASGTHTQAMWLVEDVESAVAALKARGVVFEEYEMPSLKTVNSIATVGQAKEPGFKIAKAISSRWFSLSKSSSRRTPLFIVEEPTVYEKERTRC